MKKITQQSIALIALCAIAFFANSVSAKPAVTPPCTTADQTCVTTTNTIFPVHIGATSQIKQASLAVGWFVAKLNAGFNGGVDIEGVLTGGDQPSSTLAFGSTTGAKPVVVSTDINGTTYIQGGSLYTDKAVAPTGERKALCATQKGDIVFCDGSSGTGSSTTNPNPGGTGGGGTVQPLSVSSYNVTLNGNQLATCTINLSAPVPFGQNVTASVRINYNVVSPPGAPGTKNCTLTIMGGESTSSTSVVLTSGTTYSAVTGSCVESSSSNAAINPAIKC